jgi:hypothetical protein
LDTSVAPAMCITLGKVSLEDCPLLTWSLGWTWFDLRRGKGRGQGQECAGIGHLVVCRSCCCGIRLQA